MRISDWSSDVCSSDLFHLEDAPGIGALALEHAGAIVQPVAQHVQLGVAPGHRLAVVPDDAVTVVEWDYGHRLFRPQNLANFRSEEHTSALQSLMRISYAVFCLKKKKHTHEQQL